MPSPMNEQDLQRMSQIMRHRLRNIASGIRGALGLIEEEGAAHLPPGLLEYFPLMLRECDALQDVAQRVSLFFDDPPPAQPVPADELTLRAISALAGRFPSTEIRTRGTCEGVVNGWMEIALRELLTNGCEAAPHGAVDIRLRCDRGNAVWVVSDSGPGVETARVPDPFAPFATARPRHLGLGLSIARRLVMLVGGACAQVVDHATGGAWCVELTCPVMTVDERKIEGGLP